MYIHMCVYIYIHTYTFICIYNVYIYIYREREELEQFMAHKLPKTLRRMDFDHYHYY